MLDGGAKAWEAAGYELFSGVNVPSKAFGEWVEHHYGTESVDPPELKSWIDGGQNIVVLDSRTHEEFVRMSIPTGISVPGGELVYRIGDIAPDPKTLVVVNCAGRTRSIMGAESLRRAGIPNKVVALRNGTMGWELASPASTSMGHQRAKTHSCAPKLAIPCTSKHRHRYKSADVALNTSGADPPQCLDGHAWRAASHGGPFHWNDCGRITVDPPATLFSRPGSRTPTTASLPLSETTVSLILPF